MKLAQLHGIALNTRKIVRLHKKNGNERNEFFFMYKKNDRNKFVI